MTFTTPLCKLGFLRQINTDTTVHFGQASYGWINKTLGMSAQAVREDRILDKAENQPYTVEAQEQLGAAARLGRR